MQWCAYVCFANANKWSSLLFRFLAAILTMYMHGSIDVASSAGAATKYNKFVYCVMERNLFIV